MTNVNETMTATTNATPIADTSAPAKTNFDPLGFIEESAAELELPDEGDATQ